MKGVKGILLMGGKGERFGDCLPKQYHFIHGKPVYLWTLEKFLASLLFEEVILVVDKENIENVKATVPSSVRIISGGNTRQQSCFLGLLSLKNETKYVVIHDAVRPCVSQEILKNNVVSVQQYEAVDTCIPSADTLVQINAAGKIISIPDRTEFLRGQTPQSFAYPLILKAHQTTNKTNCSDDCRLVLDLGKEVHVVRGEETNLKITTPLDLLIAEKLLIS